MSAKDRSAAAKKEFKTTVRKLRSKLERADARVGELKNKAAQLEKSRAELEAQVRKLTKRLKKTRRPAEPQKASPDATWTVVQLRAEARSRGLAGLSGKSKAELLAALAKASDATE